MSQIEDYLLHLEKNLMTGNARWVADFTESFRAFKINDVNFDMVVRGNTRGKGFLLSKLFAYTALPNYQVVCLVFNSNQFKQFERRSLNTVLDAVKSYMKENELKWSWLIIAQKGAFSEAIKNVVSSLAIQEVGVALVDVDSKTITSSQGYLGKTISRYIK